jgi:hypothetical protein
MNNETIYILGLGLIIGYIAGCVFTIWLVYVGERWQQRRPRTE